MPTLQIDNTTVTVEPGATILDAARKIGLEIPTLCHLDGCTPQTSCMACVVRVNGAARLVPSCATKAADGMVVESESPDVKAARRTALELLLSDHAGDCLAPCTNVCPAHMDIPLMIRQISAGQLHDAIVTVKQHIALPATLGRICPELCENGCRRGKHDSPVAICRLKRHVADEDLATGSPYIPPRLPDTGKSIAIAGTGPAGLAAAYYLLQRGHSVTLFDDRAEPGGNLRYAVPIEKLPRDVLDGEIDILRRMGATFRQNTRVGADVPLADLQTQFDAVLLCLGEVTPDKAKALGIPMAGKGLKVNRDTMMTPTPGLFAAGAVLTPFKHAIRAVADGRNAALSIDRFLRTGLPAADKPSFTVRLGVLNEAELRAFTFDAVPAPRNELPHPRNFDVAEAIAEADRCLHCDCHKLHDCRLRHWSDAYDASPTAYKVDRRTYERDTSHPCVTHEPGKCIACGLCVQIAERHREPLGLTYVGRGFDVRIGIPLDGALTEALRQVAADCARACPTAALTLKSDS